MPKVNGKKFAYTKSGKKAAQKYKAVKRKRRVQYASKKS